MNMNILREITKLNESSYIFDYLNRFDIENGWQQDCRDPSKMIIQAEISGNPDRIHLKSFQCFFATKEVVLVWDDQKFRCLC